MIQSERISQQGTAASYLPVLDQIDRSKIGYCLLRGDLQPDHPFKDVDLLVRPSDRSALLDILARSGFLEKGRPQFPHKTVCVRYRGGEYLCIDIHEEIVQEGLIYMDREEALSRRVRRGGYYFLSDEELVIHLVWHNLLRRNTSRPESKEQIRELLRKEIDWDCIRQHLRMFGLSDLFERASRFMTGEEESLRDRARLRKEFIRAVCRHKKGNRRTHYRYRMNCWRLFRPRGKVIALVGPDGSGKSTVLAAIKKRSQAIHGLKIETVYLGPWGQMETPWVRRLRKAGITPVLEPWGGRLAERFVKRGTGSFVFLFFKWLKSIVKGMLFYSAVYLELLYRYLKSVFPQVRRGRCVVSDRYITDLRYLYKGNPIRNYPFLRYLVCRFFPKPDLFVLLDNRAEVIHARKEDLSIEQIERFRELYRRAICMDPHEIVTTDRSPEEISDHILERMLRLSVSK